MVVGHRAVRRSSGHRGSTRCEDGGDHGGIARRHRDHHPQVLPPIALHHHKVTGFDVPRGGRGEDEASMAALELHLEVGAVVRHEVGVGQLVVSVGLGRCGGRLVTTR